MAEVLGGWDLLTTGKATVAGAVSSACTFGAVTIAQTLFKKGVSPQSTFAFRFAATNIVFELGILIYILLSPAFLAAELLGGFLLRLVKWRTGAQGRISALKRGYGMDRTRIHGIDGARTWIGHGVLAHNLVHIAAMT